MFMFYRASFHSLATPPKRKAQAEGDDTEEDVEELKVRAITSWQHELMIFIVACLFYLNKRLVQRKNLKPDIEVSFISMVTLCKC